MSIWGSLIGGMVGFSLGGPFGMLLGSLIGGKISRARSGSSRGFGDFCSTTTNFCFIFNSSCQLSLVRPMVK